MPFNPNWGGNYPLALFLRRLNRTLARFGVAPSRVRLIGQVPTRADLLAVMSLADVYLDSFPYSGACSLIDPLLVGLPIVECLGNRLRTAQGGSLLSCEGLGDAVCPDVAAYVARAVRLARDQTFRYDQRTRATAASTSLACLKTAPYAKRFERFCLDTISAASACALRLRDSTVGELQERIARSATLALADPVPAARRLDDSDLVQQIFAPYLATLAGAGESPQRVVYVGDGSSTPTWPGPEAGVRLEAFALGQAREAARAAGNAVLVRIDALGSGFDLPLGLARTTHAPRLIAARFDVAHPRQPIEEIARAVSEMRTRGYSVALFEYRRAGLAWGAVLADVALHLERLGERGDQFGVLVFYKSNDTVFLTLLAQLLDSAAPAPKRGLVGGVESALPAKRSPPKRAKDPRGKARRSC